MQGTVAVVTGGGYGMGRASARRFAEAGARMEVVDINPVTAAETVTLIEADGGTAAAFTADVGDERGVRDMVAFTVSTFGGLDYAHNNAGIPSGTRPVVGYEVAALEAVLRTNLVGTFLCMKYEYEIPAMLAGARERWSKSHPRPRTRAASSIWATPPASTAW